MNAKLCTTLSIGLLCVMGLGVAPTALAQDGSELSKTDGEINDLAEGLVDCFATHAVESDASGVEAHLTVVNCEPCSPYLDVFVPIGGTPYHITNVKEECAPGGPVEWADAEETCDADPAVGEPDTDPTDGLVFTYDIAARCLDCTIWTEDHEVTVDPFPQTNGRTNFNDCGLDFDSVEVLIDGAMQNEDVPTDPTEGPS